MQRDPSQGNKARGIGLLFSKFGPISLTSPRHPARLTELEEAPLLGLLLFHETFILFGVVSKTWGTTCLVSDGIPSPSQVPP